MVIMIEIIIISILRLEIQTNTDECGVNHEYLINFIIIHRQMLETGFLNLK